MKNCSVRGTVVQRLAEKTASVGSTVVQRLAEKTASVGSTVVQRLAKKTASVGGHGGSAPDRENGKRGEHGGDVSAAMGDGSGEHEMKTLQLLTSKRVAQMLSVPEGTLRYWRNVGIGPVWHKLEGSIRYDVDDVSRYVEKNRRIPSVRAFMEEHDGSL